MKRKHNLRKITSRRTYSTEEIAEVLGVHIQTIRTWRKEGLLPIENCSSPYLFLGSDIKDFLSKEMNKQKVKLAQNELYCLKCKKAVIPQNRQIIDRNILIGKDVSSIFLAGNCPHCGMRLRRFSSAKYKVVPVVERKLAPSKPQMSLFEPSG